MIHLYGIAFRNYRYLTKSLNSILRTATEPLDITIVDSFCSWPGSESQKIRKYLRRLVKKKLISRALFFDENVRGHGLVLSIKHFPPEGPESFFLLTDLDLIFDPGWLEKTKQAHKDGHILTGVGLKTENYLPPNAGFEDNPEVFGTWMQGINKKVFFEQHTTERNCVDSTMHNIFKNHGTILKLDDRAYHQAWDIFLPKANGGDPDYAIHKAKLGVDWVFKSAPGMKYRLISQ